MYQFNSRVRYSEIGPDKHLTLPAIINYFQDCSTFHSEAIGVGLDFLEKEKRAWILNSWQIVVEKYPYLGDSLTICTWAHEFKGAYGNRNFLLKDEHGNPFAYANSLWIYMDTENSRMLRIPQEVALPYGYEPKYPMNYAPRKISLPSTFEVKDPFSVVASNIDTNNHVNNEQYIQMAATYLPKDFIISQMRAEYRSSAILGDIIVPNIYCKDDIFIVTLRDTSNSIYAIIEFTRKDS
ncbi:MAG: acyl-[acyl-carrier-protein] thioesterase [Velocimicrobium sp.]